MTYKFFRYLFEIFFCSMAFIARADIEKARELSEDNGIKHLFSNTMDDLLARVFTMTTLGSEYVGGIDITDENVALNVMVMFLNLAQNRGAFRIDESAKIYECIKTFQKTQSESK